MIWLRDHLAHVGATLAAGGGVVAFILRDLIKDWWEDYKADRRLAREQRATERGRGNVLEKELIAILKSDLAANAALLKELTVTMTDFRALLRGQVRVAAKTLEYVRTADARQKWIARQLEQGRPS